jgi:aminopeptidase N
MGCLPWLRRGASTLALAAILVVPAAATAAGSVPGSPGAAGLGDRLFPTLGNGGYDVRYYHLALRYETSDPAQSIDGTVTITARATQNLSSFNLDWAGDPVGAVEVNGRAATFSQQDEELVITPDRTLRDGRRFVVEVSRFTATPTVVDPEDDATTAFFVSPDGSATALQPAYAHRVFPSNDHPRDKASFSFAIDVPEGTTAVANGVPAGTSTRDGRTVWRYRQRQPMATELTQLAVGDFEVTERGKADGVPLRDVTPRRLSAELLGDLALAAGHMEWLQDRVGRYPFDLYGSLVVDAPVGFALETQTLSFFDLGWFEAPQGVWEPTMVHELAHQWFGDSVAPWEWSDLWLNEGHATWYEIFYAEEHGQLVEDTTNYPREEGFATVEELMRYVYSLGDQWRAQWGPVARQASAELDTFFSLNVYLGGALVLYALRERVGHEAFDAIERAWASRYEGESASTDDFIALASEVSGEDLTDFLEEWVYGTETPAMPGHPDWTVEPVPAPAPA